MKLRAWDHRPKSRVLPCTIAVHTLWNIFGYCYLYCFGVRAACTITMLSLFFFHIWLAIKILITDTNYKALLTWSNLQYNFCKGVESRASVDGPGCTAGVDAACQRDVAGTNTEHFSLGKLSTVKLIDHGARGVTLTYQNGSSLCVSTLSSPSLFGCVHASLFIKKSLALTCV